MIVTLRQQDWHPLLEAASSVAPNSRLGTATPVSVFRGWCWSRSGKSRWKGTAIASPGGVESAASSWHRIRKSGVRIGLSRPIECKVPKGTSFYFPTQEEAALAETLKAWRGDAELAKMEPVGWYRAHTRSEILLSDADLVFYTRFFPQSWQVGLIVRPASFAATRGGFFFREPDGSIRTQSSYREVRR